VINMTRGRINVKKRAMKEGKKKEEGETDE
jgi:hypothetical protein